MNKKHISIILDNFGAIVCALCLCAHNIKYLKFNLRFEMRMGQTEQKKKIKTEKK